MKIVLVTAASMPKPDPESHLLVAALHEAGVAATLVAWDSDVPWALADLVMVRTPWDYVDRLEEFLRWVDRVDAVTRLVNPAAVLHWNTHKRYLLQLIGCGVPVVPTRLVERGAWKSDTSWLSGFGPQFVVKPAVGVGARGAMRGASGDPAFLDRATALAGERDVLVQPFIDSVEVLGESSLVFAGGQFSHAVRKIPRAGDYRVQDHYGGTVVTHAPTPAELRVAYDALAVAPGTCVYARIDLVHTADGPAIMEMELVEPELFMRVYPDAARRFASVLIDAARG